MIRYMYVIPLALAVSVWVGCGKSTTVTGPDGETTTVTERGGNIDITVEGQDGEKTRFSASGGSVAMPDGYPTDSPLYPGATPFMSSSDGEAMHVVLKTPDAVDKVTAFYTKALKQQGWEVQSTMNTPESVMLQADKGERTHMVVITRDGEETMINLNVSTGK